MIQLQLKLFDCHVHEMQKAPEKALLSASGGIDPDRLIGLP